MTTVRSGITAADERLIEALYVPLRRFAAIVSSWGDDPDDLLHDAWLRVLERRSLSDLEDPAAYLKRTMVNLAANRRRQTGSRRWLRGRWNVQGPVATVDGYPSDLADLATLPTDQRATLYLAEVEGFSYDEVGQMMGCTASAARMRAMRARRHLRSVLDAEVCVRYLMRRCNVDDNQRQKMQRWADRGDHGGATDLIDRLSSSLSSSSAPLVPEHRVRPLHGFAVAAGAAVLTIVVIVTGVLAVRLGPGLCRCGWCGSLDDRRDSHGRAGREARAGG